MTQDALLKIAVGFVWAWLNGHGILLRYNQMTMHELGFAYFHPSFLWVLATRQDFTGKMFKDSSGVWKNKHAWLIGSRDIKWNSLMIFLHSNFPTFKIV